MNKNVALTEIALTFLPAAKWSHEGPDKNDFDGEFLSISNRYYPSRYQNNGLCSAISAIHIRDNSAPYGYRVLLQAEFEAPTEQEVKSKVEAWVKAECSKILLMLVQGGLTTAATG